MGLVATGLPGPLQVTGAMESSVLRLISGVGLAVGVAFALCFLCRREWPFASPVEARIAVASTTGVA